MSQQPSNHRYFLPKEYKGNVDDIIQSLHKLELAQTVEDLLTDDEDDIVNTITDDEERYSTPRDISNIGKISTVCFSSLYNSSYEKLSIHLLKEKCTNVDLYITDVEANEIEKLTRDQANSSEWHQLRKGRITASIFKAVCCTDPDKPSISLLTKICYPEKVAFTSKYTEWGRNNEQRALDQFKTYMQTNHTNFSNVASGLIVLPEYPYFGASPDGLCCCDCCGKGCIEIKCPYSLKDGESFNILTTKRNPFLIKNEGKFDINKKHDYYFQIQMQLFLTKRNYCYFVVWSPKRMLQIKVLQDKKFWLKYSEKGETFFKSVVLPELFGKYFTRSKSVMFTSEATQVQINNVQ